MANRMNAYELAEKLDLEPYGIYGEQAANMLRQQADRIAELEGELSRYELRDLEQTSRIAELEKQQKTEPDFYSEQGYPLYTTPQIKELSDEEIDSLIAEYKIGEFNGFYVDKAMTESMQRRYKNVLDFARAILKKASEK